jgi:hypothetical protein
VGEELLLPIVKVHKTHQLTARSNPQPLVKQQTKKKYTIIDTTTQAKITETTCTSTRAANAAVMTPNASPALNVGEPH